MLMPWLNEEDQPSIEWNKKEMEQIKETCQIVEIMLLLHNAAEVSSGIKFYIQYFHTIS